MLLIDGAIRHVSSKANRRGSQNRDNQGENPGLNNLNEIENELEANGGFGRHSFAGAGRSGTSMPNMQMPGNGGMPNMNSGNGMSGMNHPPSNYFANARFGELVIELNQSSFPNRDSENVWMVMFYAPWCGACKGMRKQWALLAYRTPENIKVGSIDCTTNFNRQFCSTFKIAGFPHIKLFAKQKQVEYKGRREVYDMKQFALLYRFKATDNANNVGKGSAKSDNENKGRQRKRKRKKCLGGVFTKKSGVRELCSTYFPDSESKYPWLINFYLSWDKYSKSFHKVWRKVAKTNTEILEDPKEDTLPLKVGAFDCSGSKENEEMCNDFGLPVKNTSFPSVFIVWGDAVVKYPKSPRKSTVERILKWGRTVISDDSDI